MLGNIRGLARGFIRSAIGAGRAAAETFSTLVAGGLGYVEDVFKTDYDTYSEALEKAQQISFLDKDYLVPGGLHSESPDQLNTKFKYDITTEWETIEGKTIEQSTSVSSNYRLTQNEIEEAAADQMEDYSPEGGVFHGPFDIQGAWYRREGIL